MIILTPNRRLAAFSQQIYNQQQAATQVSCWSTAQILPLDVWLLQVWDLCLDHNLQVYKPIISGKQQQILIEQIIQQANLTEELLRVTATAQNVIQAWKFLQQWQIDLDRVAAYADYSADTAAFCGWIRKYLQWLDEHQYYDMQGMVDILIANLPIISQLLPKKICLRGFNELTPQYANLFAQLQVFDVAITYDQLTLPGAHVAKSGFENFKHELQAAAAWATDKLAKNENQIVGIVIPDLEQVRDYVHNYLGTVFTPQWLNISAPLPLNNYDLIAVALQILKLADPMLNYNDFSILLRSPFIANFARDASQRAQLDRMLREKVEAKISWQKLLSLIPETWQDLKAMINDFCMQETLLQGKHAASHWATQIQTLLQCWGWPGDALNAQDINTQERDLLACWRALLEEYCKLNTVMPKHTFAEAIQLIRRLANETPFLPSETGLTKIHVLGLLEAEGLIFDHLWVCGMSRDNWPPAANPSPFIPLEIQRQFDLPHSTAQRELLMAQKYTNNLQQGGKDSVIFSYPQLVDDYKMQPSNLIANIPEVEFAMHKDVTEFVPSGLEEWQDSIAPAYTETYISGGASSLRLQAQCPFKANAELRLKVKPLAEPQLFLTPLMRGSLVHNVLEAFWRICGSHAQLIAYTPQELEHVLRSTIQQQLQIWQRDLPQTLTNYYMQLEAKRLYNLLARWLEYEAQRSPFVVYQLEQKTLISIGPLQINMQIDRIDQVGTDFVIIDYKTGQAQVSKWFPEPGEPIIEPQLPIYAVSVPHNIIAVAFAALRAPELKFAGIADSEGILPDVKALPDWSDTLQRWAHKLQQTAHSFVAGNAHVEPYTMQICTTCQLQSFCRIYEHAS